MKKWPWNFCNVSIFLCCHGNMIWLNETATWKPHKLCIILSSTSFQEIVWTLSQNGGMRIFTDPVPTYRGYTVLLNPSLMYWMKLVEMRWTGCGILCNHVSNQTRTEIDHDPSVVQTLLCNLVTDTILITNFH